MGGGACDGGMEAVEGGLGKAGLGLVEGLLIWGRRMGWKRRADSQLLGQFFKGIDEKNREVDTEKGTYPDQWPSWPAHRPCRP